MAGPIGGGPLSPGSPIPEQGLSPLIIPGMRFITKDTLAPASTEAGSIPIIVFAKAVQETIDKLKEQLNKDEYQDNVQNTRFYKVIVNRALFLRQFLLDAQAAINLQALIVPQREGEINDANNVIDGYNAGVLNLGFSSNADLQAVRTFYNDILSFINPASPNYDNQTFITNAINTYKAYNPGIDVTILTNAIQEFFTPTSPFYQDFAALGNPVQQFFSEFSNVVDPTKANALIIGWVNYFNPLSSGYHDANVLNGFFTDYAPFLNPGYTTLSAASPITEQEETDRVNQAILDFNNSSSPHFGDTAYLSLIFAQYDAYCNQNLTTPINALNNFLLIGSPTPADIDSIEFVVRTYSRYIEGGPDILASFDAYHANPTPANLASLQSDLIAYRIFLLSNPVFHLFRSLAVDTVNAQISGYNGEVASNNLIIDQINAVRIQVGLAPIPHQIPAVSALPLPPPPTITDGSVLLPERELVPHVIKQTSVFETPNAFKDAVDKAFQEALLFFGAMGQKISSSRTDIAFVQFLFNGTNVLKPKGETTVINPATPATNPSPGVGYGTTALDLSSPFVEAIVSSALIDAFIKDFNVLDSSSIIDAIKVATLQYLHDLSLVTGGGAIAFLAGALPSISLLPYLGIDEAAVSVVFAVEYAKQVANFFSSDLPQDTIQQILNSNPAFGNISPDKLAELAGGISSAIAASVGIVSLVTIAIALRSPGLTGSLLSLIPGIQALDDNVLSPPIFAELVSNGLSGSLVGNLLIGSGLDASASAEVLRAALGAGSPDDFYSSLQAALIAAGVAPGQASSLALEGTSLVLQQGNQGNFSQSELDSVLMEGVIDKQTLAQALNSETLASAVVDNLNLQNAIENSVLQDSIAADFRLKDEITQSSIRANILGDSVIRDQIQEDNIRRDITMRDIRDAIRNQEIADNQNIEQSDIKAQEAIDALREDEALNNRVELAYVDQEALKSSLQKAFIARGIEENEAIKRAEVINNNLKHDREYFASRNSLRSAIRDIIVNHFGIDRAGASLIAAGVDLGIPPRDSTALSNIGRKPGKELTLYEVVQDVETRIVALLGGRLSREKTDEIIDRLTDRVINNDNSLNRLIARSITQVVKLQNTELNHALSSQIRELVKPNKEIFAFIEKLKDPGNALVYSVWSGIMYSGNQASNYKRDLDIMI